MSYQDGALLEPLSVVLAALRVAKLTLGRGAVICGAGPIGLTALLAARASGAHPLVITDVEPTRLDFARQLVPSCLTYQVDPKLDASDNAKGIRELFGARGGAGEDGEERLAPPCVIECTGAESSVCTASFAVQRGGRVVVVGVGRDTMNNLPFMRLSLSEVSRLLDVLFPLLIVHDKAAKLTQRFHRSICGSSTDTQTHGRREYHV